MSKQQFDHEQQLRQQLVRLALSLFNRGYSSGSASNISVLLPDGTLLATPTNSSFGELHADELSKVAADGQLISGLKPTKEIFMHQAMYRQRPQCRAVVHLHSPYLTAVSCLPGLDPANCLPPITPYYIMRVGQLPLIDYYPPGDKRIGEEVGRLASRHNAMLLANHGPVVGGGSLQEAVFNAEELEATARLYLTLLPHGFTRLSDEQIAHLEQRYPQR